MPRTLYIGREIETAEFGALLRKKTASLVVCQGRRRIGKSTFFRHCAADVDHFLAFEGLPPRPGIDRGDQLAAFSANLSALTKAPRLPLPTWPQAFQLLASLLPSAGTVLLLFDEISWMAQGDADFAGHLKAAWDNLFSQRSRLILALCGSVSSWIEANILNNTGFAGRCSWQFRLPPLSLPACNAFWRDKPVSVAEKLKILSVTGGVPRYLEEIDPSASADQNLERICFHPSGLLFNEFHQIFHDIFSRRAEHYRRLVSILADGPRTPNELSQGLRQGRGGSLTGAAEDLVLAGFLARDHSFDPNTGDILPRKIRYRICDNYLRFFLKYIEPASDQIRKGLYQRTPIDSLRAWDTIAGLQLEALVLSNLATLLERLGLTNVPVINAGPYFQPATAKASGCQVDLLIRTRQSLYLCEVKFRRKIEPAVVAEMKRKAIALRVNRSLSLRTVLIYEGELHPEIGASDFFDHLVPFGSLLESAPNLK